MSPFTLKEFIRGFRLAGKGMGCVPSGKAGIRHIRQRLQGRTDGASRRQGGSVIMKAHPEDVWTMEVPGEELKDI